METILDKKKIRVIFWFAFKMGHKAAETTRNINNAFGSGTDNKHPVQCRGGSRNFATETRALKLRSAVAGHQKLTTTDDSAITEADPFTTTLEVTQKLNIDHSTVI